MKPEVLVYAMMRALLDHNENVAVQPQKRSRRPKAHREQKVEKTEIIPGSDIGPPDLNPIPLDFPDIQNLFPQERSRQSPPPPRTYMPDRFVAPDGEGNPLTHIE